MRGRRTRDVLRSLLSGRIEEHHGLHDGRTVRISETLRPPPRLEEIVANQI